jgi:hypothetical protein
MSNEGKPETVRVEVLGGVEGPCLAIFKGISGERIAGPKPWGGGKTLHSWEVPVADILKALGLDSDEEAREAAQEREREADIGSNLTPQQVARLTR